MITGSTMDITGAGFRTGLATTGDASGAELNRLMMTTSPRSPWPDRLARSHSASASTARRCISPTDMAHKLRPFRVI
jgi:hypothetical protein